MDCQRYNQFDGLNLGASDFLQAVEESLAWRELFTLPQVPPAALATIRLAFSQITWPTGTDDLRRDLDGLFVELDVLLSGLAAHEDGETIDLFRYLIDLFWLDLGQLLYALHRGRSVVDGLSALRNLTFATRDFWTEAAFADRQGLTKRNWHPMSGGALTTGRR